VAEIRCDDTTLTVALSPIEMLGAMHRSLTIPLEHIVSVRVSSAPRRELRGIRAPGTGLPGVIRLGTWRGRNGKDFAAVYRNRPVLVVDLADEAFQRLVVTVADADAICHRIAELATSAAR
jgi:hypothetical protein